MTQVLQEVGIFMEKWKDFLESILCTCRDTEKTSDKYLTVHKCVMMEMWEGNVIVFSHRGFVCFREKQSAGS